MSLTQRANDVQHGGSHYRTDYQHWDYMADLGYGAEYFCAAATKYITRHENKNGPEDVVKAIHYTEKLRELVTTGKVFLFPAVPEDMYEEFQFKLNKFLAANHRKPSSDEGHVIRILSRPRTIESLNHAVLIMQNILIRYEKGILQKPAKMSSHDFTTEGFTAEKDFWQCKFCKEHIRIPPGEDPARHHSCALPKGYVDQDQGAQTS